MFFFDQFDFKPRLACHRNLCLKMNEASFFSYFFQDAAQGCHSSIKLKEDSDVIEACADPELVFDAFEASV